MRSQTHVSKLPVFSATSSKDFPQFLIVWCPRADCPGTANNRPFLVHESTWLLPLRHRKLTGEESSKIVGRSCPYCFRASRIP